MDDRTGEIYQGDEVERMRDLLRDRGEVEHLVEMKEAPTAGQLRRNPPHVKGHEPCPCGSGKRFKKCCKRKAKRWHVQAEAQKFLASVVARGAPQVQRDEMLMAFMGGFSSAAAFFSQEITKFPDEVAVEMIEDVHQQLREFAEELE